MITIRLTEYSIVTFNNVPEAPRKLVPSGTGSESSTVS